MSQDQASEAKRVAIEQAQVEWGRLWELVNGLSEEEMTAPNALGSWSVKDVFAHLDDWHTEALARMPELLAGGDAACEQYNDSWNDVHIGLKADLSPSEVLTQAKIGYRLFITLMKSLPRSAFVSNSTLRGWVFGCGVEHYQQHFAGLQAWQSRQRGQDA